MSSLDLRNNDGRNKLVYDDVLKIARYHLNEFEHGQLKEFATKHDLHYPLLSNIKNGNLQNGLSHLENKRYPLIIAKLLNALGYSVNPVKEVIFVFDPIIDPVGNTIVRKELDVLQKIDRESEL